MSIQYIDQLAQILSKPAYSTMLQPKLKYAVEKERTAWHDAKSSVDYALGNQASPKLRHPITITELVPDKYPIHLYRAFDGVDKAMTLGSWWGDRKLVKHSVNACIKSKGSVTPDIVIDNMLKAMYVHPNWNRGKAIARMTIPVGASVPVITALGDWRALRTAAPIPSEQDLQNLGFQPDSLAKQYFLPLYSDMWISKVPEGPDWPLGKI